MVERKSGSKEFKYYTEEEEVLFFDIPVEERNSLNELKIRITDIAEADDDSVLLRFLRHHDLNVDIAEFQYRSYHKWKTESCFFKKTVTA